MKLQILVCLPFIILGSPALAQDFSFPSPDYIGGWATTTLPDITMDRPSGVSANDLHPSGTSSANDVKSVITPDSVEALHFETSMKRRAINIERFVKEWSKTDPTSAANAKPALTAALPQIDQMMRPMGLRANNVADAYTLWWVIAWHAANKQPLEQNNQLMAAVKQQASNALLSTPKFASFNDVQKQEMAESLLIQAALIDGHIDAAAGNPTQQAALAKAVNQGAKKMGLDLTTMDLTENGFVPRSGKRSDASVVDPAAPEGADTQMAVKDNAGTNAAETDNGKLALYGVGGVALLAGMFALGKSFGNKG